MTEMMCQSMNAMDLGHQGTGRQHTAPDRMTVGQQLHQQQEEEEEVQKAQQQAQRSIPLNGLPPNMDPQVIMRLATMSREQLQKAGQPEALVSFIERRRPALLTEFRKYQLLAQQYQQQQHVQLARGCRSSHRRRECE